MLIRMLRHAPGTRTLPASSRLCGMAVQQRVCSGAVSPAPSASAAEPAAAPAAPASKPSSSADPASTANSPASVDDGDRKSYDDRDIAFKPTTDGWGYTHSYASGWDRIFAQKKPQPAVSSVSASDTAPAAPAVNQTKLRALDDAFAVGALSERMYKQARSELLQQGAA